MTYLPRCAAQARAHRAKLLFGLAALGAAAELHGDMTQAARLASLDAFRKVRSDMLSAAPCCRSLALFTYDSCIAGESMTVGALIG